jgi:hypothetical protein
MLPSESALWTYCIGISWFTQLSDNLSTSASPIKSNHLNRKRSWLYEPSLALGISTALHGSPSKCPTPRIQNPGYSLLLLILPERITRPDATKSKWITPSWRYQIEVTVQDLEWIKRADMVGVPVGSAARAASFSPEMAAGLPSGGHDKWDAMTARRLPLAVGEGSWALIPTDFSRTLAAPPLPKVKLEYLTSCSPRSPTHTKLDLRLLRIKTYYTSDASLAKPITVTNWQGARKAHCSTLLCDTNHPICPSEGSTPMSMINLFNH